MALRGHQTMSTMTAVFDRSLICHLSKRIVATIQGERRPFHGQVHRDFTSQHHQKESMLQPLLAVSRAELEPQEPHHLKGTGCPLDWCLGFEHRPWVGDTQRRTTVPMRLRVCQFREFHVLRTRNWKKTNEGNITNAPVNPKNLSQYRSIKLKWLITAESDFYGWFWRSLVYSGTFDNTSWFACQSRKCTCCVILDVFW